MGVFEKPKVFKISRTCAGILKRLNLNDVDREFLGALTRECFVACIKRANAWHMQDEIDAAEKQYDVDNFWSTWETRFEEAFPQATPYDRRIWFNGLFTLQLFSNSDHFRDFREVPDKEKLFLREVRARDLASFLRFFLKEQKLNGVEIDFG